MKNATPIAICIIAAIAIGAFGCFKLLSKPKHPAPPAASSAVEEPASNAAKPVPKMPTMAMNAVLKRYQAFAKNGDPLAAEICRFACYDLKRYDDGDAYISRTPNATVDANVVGDVFNSDQAFFVFMQGVCLIRGLGVEVDAGKAYERFSVTSNLPYSQVEAACCLLGGKGVEADPEKGLEMLEALAPALRIDVKQGRQSGRSFVSNDGYFRTFIGTNAWDAGKYLPAAIALGDSFRDGAGVAKDNAKALQCYLAASLGGLKAADERMQSLFGLAVKDAIEDSKHRLEEYSRSPEFVAEVKAYQDKNAQLKGMPKALAAETERFKARQFELKQAGIVMESVRTSGWLAFNNFKRGVPIIGYEVDRGRYIDLATDYLSRYYRMNRVFPQDIKKNAERLRRKLGSLAEVAASSGNQMDALSLKALELSLAAKITQDWRSGRQDFEATCSALSDINEKSPSAETLVSESYALLHQSDMLEQEMTELKQQLEDLKANAEIRELSWTKSADRTFGGSSLVGRLAAPETPEEAKAKEDAPKEEPASYEMKSKVVNRSQIDSITEDAGSYVVLIKGCKGVESKTVTIGEFSELRKKCSAYIDAKVRLEKLIKLTGGKIAWNVSRKSRNSKILTEMLSDKEQVSTDSADLKNETYGVELK